MQSKINNYMFFSNNKDRIFVFPRSLRSDVGKEYNFQNNDRLISFLKKDPIVNPEHQIALSETAELTIYDLKSLTEFEVFDRFIDKVLKSDSEKSSIVKQIQQSNRELKEKRIKNQVKLITEKVTEEGIAI